jgi:hypothetical protein
MDYRIPKYHTMHFLCEGQELIVPKTCFLPAHLEFGNEKRRTYLLVSFFEPRGGLFPSEMWQIPSKEYSMAVGVNNLPTLC